VEIRNKTFINIIVCIFSTNNFCASSSFDHLALNQGLTYIHNYSQGDSDKCMDGTKKKKVKKELAPPGIEPGILEYQRM
jgi:hypothetical protein